MLTRTTAIDAVLRAFPDDPIVVPLGTTSREVISQAAERANHIHLLDSMGLAPAVGAGLALGLEGSRDGKVVALEGDGGLLMGFSILATLSHLRPRGLVLIVLDDGVYAATGGQPTGSDHVDMCGVARACDIEAAEVDDGVSLDRALEVVRTSDVTHLVRVRIDVRTRQLPHYLPDPALLADRFRRYLSTLTASG